MATIDADPDAKVEPTQADLRRQAEAEALRATRRHYHRYTEGESVGSLFSHTHADDEEGHTHPGKQAFPGRADGGYWEEVGPATFETPRIPDDVLERVARVFADARARPPHELTKWRLRLVCGHLVERTAHRTYTDPQRAFTGSTSCTECGLDPAVIIAAKALGRAGEPPAPPARPTPPSPLNLDVKRKRLAKLRAELAQLEEELAD